jgi:hypothetical protein
VEEPPGERRWSEVATIKGSLELLLDPEDDSTRFEALREFVSEVESATSAISEDDLLLVPVVDDASNGVGLAVRWTV